MAATLTDRLDVSREKLDGLRRDVTHRTEELGGRARDAAMGAILRAGATALDGIARSAKTLPGTKSVSSRLAARASALEDARTALSTPSIPGYDELNVRQVQDALEKLDRWELLKVRAYEESNKARKTVIAAVDRRLED